MRVKARTEVQTGRTRPNACRWLLDGPRARLFRFGGCLAGASILFLWIGVSPEARAQSAGEYSVKAAFLFNFAKYVEWPGDPPGDTRPIVVGVLGEDPFGGEIDRVVKDKSINGRPIVVKRLRWGQDLRQCHILFVSSSERQRLSQILSSLKGANVLTVGETEQFDREGGIIRFMIEDNRVRFEINVDAAEQAGLKLSSKLLAVAKVVRGRR